MTNIKTVEVEIESARLPGAKVVGRRRIVRLLRANPLASAGLALGVIVVVVLVFGPLVWTRAPNAQNLSGAFSGPSGAHPLGTDQFGRDILARILVGGRVSIYLGLVSVALAFAVGLAGGVAAAVGPRAVNAVIMRLSDAFLALPQVVLAVILVASLGFGTGPLLIALAVSTAPIFLRVAYSSALSVMHEDYVAAARCGSLSTTRIVMVHVLPNIASPLLAIASLRIGMNLIIAAALNYFGLGVQPPNPEWGLMISDSQTYAYRDVSLIVIPGICILLTSLAFNLIGDGVRDWLDPRLKR
jgi:peptide/nickel transport system permease protein